MSQIHIINNCNCKFELKEYDDYKCECEISHPSIKIHYYYLDCSPIAAMSCHVFALKKMRNNQCNRFYDRFANLIITDLRIAHEITDAFDLNEEESDILIDKTAKMICSDFELRNARIYWGECEESDIKFIDLLKKLRLIIDRYNARLSPERFQKVKYWIKCLYKEFDGHHSENIRRWKFESSATSSDQDFYKCVSDGLLYLQSFLIYLNNYKLRKLQLSDILFKQLEKLDK